MRAILMASAAIVAMITVEPVMAQTSAANDGGLGEIVVTARKKEESLQHAAVAVDAVTSVSLKEAGVYGAQDITKVVPSLSITSAGGVNSSLFLRGVGNQTALSSLDPAIAISYDGVYIARPTGVTAAAFYDLERVEVLKGPQGILYGRNATGGAFNILPKKPKLGELSGGFNLALGNYQAVNVDAHVNVPIGDDIAARFAATRQVHDGYNRDGTDDRDVSAVRGQLLFEPSHNVSIRLGGDYTKLGGMGPGADYLGNYVPGPNGYIFQPASFDLSEGLGTPAANAYRSTLLGAPGFGFLTPMNARPSINAEYWGVNAEVRADLGFAKLIIIPAYRKDHANILFNTSSFNTAANVNKDEQFSLEARLDGSISKFDYLFGGFYLSDKAHQNTNFNQEFVAPIQNYDHETKSIAAFGQLTAHVSDRLRLIGGVRYTHDKKHLDGVVTNFVTFCGGLPPANLTPPASFAAGCAAPNGLPRFANSLGQDAEIAWLVSNGWIAPTSAQPFPQVLPLLNGVGTILKTFDTVVDTRKFSHVTWKASAEFDIAESSLLYVTYETGYRAGGIQLVPGRTQYRPEFLDSLSFGSKNRFFDNHVQLNLEAFWWKYKDQQIAYFVVDNNGVLNYSTENAGKVDIKGVDVDLIAKVTRGTTLTAKVQYLDSVYKSLKFVTAAPRDNIGCPSTVNGQFLGTAPIKVFDCSGRQAAYSPKWTVNLGAEQVVPLSSSLELVGSVNTAWRDSQEGSFDFLPTTRIPSQWTTDANLTLRKPGGGISISAFVLNIENKRRRVVPNLSGLGQVITFANPPRTYGLRLSAEF